LTANGIETILTDEMNAEAAIKIFLSGNLKNDPAKSCTEHQH
jgi:predicted Fe-Mo cluster-binding NifX family protein